MESSEKISINDRRINNIRHADDTALIANYKNLVNHINEVSHILYFYVEILPGY